MTIPWGGQRETCPSIHPSIHLSSLWMLPGQGSPQRIIGGHPHVRFGKGFTPDTIPDVSLSQLATFNPFIYDGVHFSVEN